MISVSTSPALASRTSSPQRPDLVGGGGVHPSDKVDRLANVAKRVVDQLCERVNLGRLRLTGQDQASASMRGQVAGDRADPAGVCGDPPRQLLLPGGGHVSNLQLDGDCLRKSTTSPEATASR